MSAKFEDSLEACTAEVSGGIQAALAPVVSQLVRPGTGDFVMQP
jgi:hypothetical protein